MAEFKLPELPYAFDALEPYIDARTMEIHHGKHHAAYVANLNKALSSHPELADRSLEDLLRAIEGLPADIRTAVRNNGGGHANHSLFWKIMAPNAGGEPGGVIGEAIRARFGDFASFREKFAASGAGRFGSGWVWLVADGSGVDLLDLPNQDSPLMQGKVPVLGLDVWEHAYYLNYQNRRPDYITAWWNTVNWSAVEANLIAARG
ncbi:MAG: superoxide dismutase [Gemmatimonadota bacterium]|jgi:Fe-Mn family superoxide dismutase|nr:superoxide dismutase [Gemmatimonadota bacterium]